MDLGSNIEAFGYAMVFVVFMPLFGGFLFYTLYEKGIFIDEFVKGSITIVDVMVAWALVSILAGIFLTFFVRRRN